MDPGPPLDQGSERHVPGLGCRECEGAELDCVDYRAGRRAANQPPGVYYYCDFAFLGGGPLF